MQIKQHIIIATLIAVTSSVIAILMLTGIQAQRSPEIALGNSYSAPVFRTSSSTAFTLTTSSQRLLGTSTSPRRLAATIQPVNCTGGSAGVAYLNTESPDAAATAGTGIAAYGSSTLAMGYPAEIPVVQAAVHGIVPAGTCTVLVSEFFAPY